MSARPTLLTQTSASRRSRESSFPSTQSRGSSTLAAWGSQSSSNGTSESTTTGGGSPTSASGRKKGPSLLLQSQTGTEPPEIHPLKHTWDVWVSHRGASNNKANSHKKEEGGTQPGQKPGKEKETREEWEGAVVKLGGFSSIESMFPFLAHLTPPSALPSSVNSSTQLFGTSAGGGHVPSSNITDYNVFRSSIAPAWEDPANAGGGRWVARLRKGVADRLWEESLFALVGEKIGGDDDRIENKVNGLVLSVRKDEDILSLWCAPTNRTERDIIRDAFRAALEPSLPAQAALNFALDFKPHPSPNGPVPTVATAGTRHERERTESPHRSERGERRNHHDGSGSRHGFQQDKDKSDSVVGVPPLSGFGSETRRGGNPDKTSSRGFPGYVARMPGGEGRERTESGHGSVGSTGSFGRPRRGSASRSGESGGWGRA
ncbi:hypothetical protein OIO90_006592 [Microbotryomycetes sp. JL221]|nr:hypothetical protein OIO90_006592 [Microbotryomycetes sp. JL221]